MRYNICSTIGLTRICYAHEFYGCDVGALVTCEPLSTPNSGALVAWTNSCEVNCCLRSAITSCCYIVSKQRALNEALSIASVQVYREYLERSYIK